MDGGQAALTKPASQRPAPAPTIPPAGEGVRTTCPYCGVGCGILATRRADGGLDIAGDADHPANRGRLCSKGSALGDTVGLEGRLLHPCVDGRRASWDEALDRVARGFRDTIAAHGPDAVAFYVSGQLLTEDYYVANKLMKGFIGSGNIDTNSRLCMASTVAGHTRAFGADVVPQNYEDLEEADLVILVGSNFAWCHPVLHQRLMAAREARGTKIVVIDPRRTATAEDADLHLPIAPDGDVAFFNGLLNHLGAVGAIDAGWAGRHTTGFRETIGSVADCDLARTAEATGLNPIELRAAFDLFARTERTVTVFSQGVNQSASGTDKVNAILNCHLATGRIGRAGCGPLSITGQPNAMGGREVGGLATQLAAHMRFEPEAVDRVGRFWNAPNVATKPGLKAVDMFRAVADGRIKAIWIMGTNPVVSMPEADAVREALRACPLVVVSEVEARTDTAALAHVALPALAWGEKSGTVTNSERRISRQRAVLPAPGEARADWDIVADVARRLGHAGFDYRAPSEVFAEHVALTAFENDGARTLDLSGLDAVPYETFAPVQWPVGGARGEGAARLFATGGFPTPDGRARLVPVTSSRRREGRRDFVLNTGRIRDQWHTMTRTGRSARLSRHYGEPFVELHPDDAAALSVAPAEIVRVANPHGTALLRALVTTRVAPGHVFVPLHWSGEVASAARVDILVEGRTDPHSGQPALKSSNVKLAPAGMDWYGFAILSERPAAIEADYWAIARTEAGWRVELAGRGEPAALSTRLLGGDPSFTRQDARGTTCHGTPGWGLVFTAPYPVAVARDWLSDAFDADPANLAPLLPGRPGGDRRDPGATVCSCLNVGINDIVACILAGAQDVAVIGERTGAGTNCGSCRSEIRRLIDCEAPAVAAPHPIAAE